MINSTNAILPATGYAMTVFTVSGGVVLECYFDVFRVMMVMMMMVVVVLVVVVVGGGSGDGCNVAIVLSVGRPQLRRPVQLNCLRYRCNILQNSL